MPVDMKRSAELLLWNRRVFSIGGVWPLDSTFVYFYICFVYFIMHAALAFMDLYSVFGDMQQMIENLQETSIHTMSGIDVILLRHSGKLRDVLRHIQEGTNENEYRDDTEKDLYMAYNSIGRAWFKGLNCATFMTIIVFYVGPLKDIVTAAINNETQQYILPFKTHLFFDIQDVRVYAFMYVWQFPIVYYMIWHTAAVAFLCTLVVYVAGEMSVLAYRIRRIGSTSELFNDYDDLTMAFRDIIKKHLQVMRQVLAIDDIFNLVLLEELLISTVLFGFVIFNLLSSTGTLYDKAIFANYCIAMLGLILVYCITGEYVIRESENLQAAYYECLWYEMEPKYQQNVVICIAWAQQPLQLTAGRFYVFSLPRFSEILKTAMAYVTMLRTVV